MRKPLRLAHCGAGANDRTMRFRRGLLPFIVSVCLLGTGMTLAAEDARRVEFQGTVSSVEPEAQTITVRTRQKDFVFQIDPQRCTIIKDGAAPAPPGATAPALSSAQVGDSVVGHLVVEGEKPIVTRLYLTTKPEPGVRVNDKPGFIVSPYRPSSSPGPAASGKGAIDVRGYRRGSMLVDEESGKIFLVP